MYIIPNPFQPQDTRPRVIHGPDLQSAMNLTKGMPEAGFRDLVRPAKGGAGRNDPHHGHQGIVVASMLQIGPPGTVVPRIPGD